MISISPKHRWIVLIAILVGLLLAWVAKPKSFRQQLEAGGVHLVKKENVTFRGISGNPSNRSGFYEMPSCGQQEFVRSLKKLGFSDRFGMTPVSMTNSRGITIKSREGVMTRGLYYKPFFDYERVWILEYEGKTTVIFDPDCE